MAGWGNIAYVACVNPFCLVRPDREDPPDFSLDDINRTTYDHGKLCRIVIAISSSQFDSAKLLVCGDGAIAIPAVSSLKSLEDVVDIFNNVMCSLLLGGHSCEAIDSRDVVTANLHEGSAIWPNNLGKSLSSQMRSKIRMKMASPTDSIELSSCRQISVSEFIAIYTADSQILDKIPSLSPSIFLRGFTEMTYGNSADALSNLWIIVEQLTEFLWRALFLADTKHHPKPSIKSRRDLLQQDSRTWSSSVRHEILFQVGVLNEVTFLKMYPARKARNDLVHHGKRPPAPVIADLYDGLLDLLQLSSGCSLESMSRLSTPTLEFSVRSDYNLDDWKATAIARAPRSEVR